MDTKELEEAIDRLVEASADKGPEFQKKVKDHMYEMVEILKDNEDEPDKLAEKLLEHFKKGS